MSAEEGRPPRPLRCSCYPLGGILLPLRMMEDILDADPVLDSRGQAAEESLAAGEGSRLQVNH